MPETVSEKIARLRSAQGLTRRELAKRAGVDPSTVGSIEAGKIPKKSRALDAILAVLEPDLKQLTSMVAAIEALPDRDRDMINALRSLRPSARRAVEMMVRELGGFKAYEDSLHNMIEDQRRKRIEALNIVQIPILRPSEDDTTQIRMVGTVAAGSGVVEFDRLGDDLEVPAEYRKCWALQVTGDSMDPLIPPGAYVLFRKSKPTTGRIVVAELPDERGHVVKILRQGERGSWSLVSANDAYEPISVPKKGTTLFKVDAIYAPR